MTPQEIATWHAVFFGHRMRALDIVAQRLPKATPEELMKEADKLLRWAAATDDTSAQ
jgi:hypothetical protein